MSGFSGYGTAATQKSAYLPVTTVYELTRNSADLQR